MTHSTVVQNGWIDVSVKERTDAATDIVSLILEANDGGLLPSYEAGSHVDIKLANGLTRQYSLCSVPENQVKSYRLGILRDPNSRGGSQWIHENLQPNSQVQISEPRNLFPLNQGEDNCILFAGGIGITPILSMAYELKAKGSRFNLHYTARDLSRAAFTSEMRAAFPEQLSLYVDDEKGAPKLNIPEILANAEVTQHIYCCGPGGFIDYVLAEAAKAGWAEDYLHVERFSGAEIDASGSFTVVAQQSGKEIEVKEGTTILEALLDAGIDADYSCESGFCETCACGVIEGVPDHRDTFQTDKEKASNKIIAICCSRSKSARLVLDI